MRIAEYKQVDVEVVSNTIIIDDYNENGEIIGQHEETVTREIPIMGMVYRDATPEEIARSEQETRIAPPPEPTIDDKLNAMMEYMGLTVQWNGGAFEVVKAEMDSGDYTNPIHIPEQGINVEFGKWYYVDDKYLPHEAKADAFVTPDDFYNTTWFDFIG